MIHDRLSSPPKEGEETLLDMIISYTEDEELQHADALEFTTGGQYILEYRKFLNSNIHLSSIIFPDNSIL